MECGACKLNCPTSAISVNSGVGCASAMIYAALTGKKEALFMAHHPLPRIHLCPTDVQVYNY